MAASSKFVSEWWLQRISAVLITAYVFLVLGLLLLNGAPDAVKWQALFANTAFKLATLLAILATAYHGLVGAMHVWPDYVKNRAVIAVLNAYTWLVAAAVALWSVYILFGMK